jgi:hypothetical protein
MSALVPITDSTRTWPHVRKVPAMNGHGPWLDHRVKSDRCPPNSIAVKYSIDEVVPRVNYRGQLNSRAIVVGLNRLAAFHRMKFDPGGDRTRW